jgi:hypothetical protein
MAGPLFRFVCTSGVLDGTPEGWVSSMLEEGELALLADDGGLDAISAVAHGLGTSTVRLVRTEATAEQQERTVMAYAGAMATVWVASSFGEAAVIWARDRGPMTLLVESDGPLAADERKRVERFVVILGRQAE